MIRVAVRGCHVIAMVVAFAVVSASSRAQSHDDNWTRCTGVDPKAAIVGCSAMLAADQLPAAKRAIAAEHRAHAYAAEGQYANAIADYGRALRIAPKSPDLLESRGLAYFAVGDDDRAIADYTQAIGFMPDAGASYDFASTFRNRGRAYLKKGQRDRAMADFNEAIRLDPNFAAAYYSRGTAVLEAGQSDRAIDDFDRALRLDRNYTDAYFNRAVAEGRSGRYVASISDLDRYIQKVPEDASAFYYLGEDDRALGQNDRAVAEYSTALRLRPDDEGALIARAVSYLAMRDYDSALRDCETAIHLSPKDGSTFLCRGAVYEAQRKYDLALPDFQRAVAIAPDLFNAWVALGKVRDAQRDFEAAIDAYSHAIGIDPNSASALNLRGFDQYELHRDAMAMTDFNRAIQIAPRYGAAFESRGFVYLREANYRAAIREFTIALQFGPTVILHYGRGASYFFLGEYRRAISDFATAAWRQVGGTPVGKTLFAVALLVASGLLGRRVHHSMSLTSLFAFYHHLLAPATIARQRAARFARAAALPLALSVGAAAWHVPLDSAWGTLWGALDLPAILVPASASALVFGLCIQGFAVRAHQIAGFTGNSPAGFWAAFGWFNLYALVLFGVGYGGVVVGYSALFSARANGWLSNVHLFGVSGVELVFIGFALTCSLAVSLVARCSLMLPAAACGHPLSLRRAWQLSGRAPWQLSVTVALYVASCAAVDWIGARVVASQPLGLLPSEWRAFADVLVTQLSIYVATALVASTLSLFYREQNAAPVPVAGAESAASTAPLTD